MNKIWTDRALNTEIKNFPVRRCTGREVSVMEELSFSFTKSGNDSSALVHAVDDNRQYCRYRKQN